MDLRRLLPHLLLFAYLLATFWLLGRAQHERVPDVAPNTKVLGFTKSFLAWWYTTGIFAALVMSLGIYRERLQGTGGISLWLVTPVLAAAFGIGCWYLLRYRVEYNHRQFVVRLPTGGHRTIAWESVVSIEDKKRASIRINIRSGKTCVITQHLPGINEFLHFASIKTRVVA